MEKDNIQKELFEFDTPKKQPNRFGRLFQKTDFAISLSAEKLVFISIGIIMLIVVAFALGVEKGKNLPGNAVQAAAVPAQVPAQRMTVSASVQQAAQAKTVNAATNITPKGKAQVNPSTQPAMKTLSDKTKPYTIVAATFTKETFAAKEAGQLKGSGFEAFVIKSEPYYLACVGSFASKDSARTTLNKVKQMHRDAYVRLR